MRIQNNGIHPKLVVFDNWLQNLGDGKLETHPGTDYVTLPDVLCSEIKEGTQVTCQDDAIKFVLGILKLNQLFHNGLLMHPNEPFWPLLMML